MSHNKNSRSKFWSELDQNLGCYHFA